jgi:hypothetical protein
MRKEQFFMVQQHQEIQRLEARVTDRTKKTLMTIAIGVPVVAYAIELAFAFAGPLDSAWFWIAVALTTTLPPLLMLWVLPQIEDIRKIRRLYGLPHQEYGPQPYVPGRDD